MANKKIKGLEYFGQPLTPDISKKWSGYNPLQTIKKQIELPFLCAVRANGVCSIFDPQTVQPTLSCER